MRIGVEAGPIVEFSVKREPVLSNDEHLAIVERAYRKFIQAGEGDGKNLLEDWREAERTRRFELVLNAPMVGERRFQYNTYDGSLYLGDINLPLIGRRRVIVR